jgi:Zn ribbon nucleic-acid-binding protein
MTATHTCPQCGEQVLVVGGFNSIDYIECKACRYSGDHWEEGGIVYDISVPTENGMRRVDTDAYLQRVAEIRARARD